MTFLTLSNDVRFVQHGVTMRSTLTTFDGYPRDDIDIPQGTGL